LTHQKFFIDVEVDADVVGDAFLLDADVGRSVIALVLAAFATYGTQFKLD